MSEVEENILVTLELPGIIPEMESEPRIEEFEENEEEIEHEYKTRDYQEKRHELMICEWLTVHGYQYERQKRCANGIIDIFVYDKKPWIIEVKRAGTPFYLYQGIAQLKFYNMCFTSVKLFLAVPGGVEKKYLPILAEFNIGVCNL